jgi:hypothetical protein
MKKRFLIYFKECALFVLYGMLIMGVIFPLANLFEGLLFQLFPGHANAGKALLTAKSILDSIEKGVLMGFLGGVTVYTFERLLSHQSMNKK